MPALRIAGTALATLTIAAAAPASAAAPHQIQTGLKLAVDQLRTSIERADVAHVSTAEQAIGFARDCDQAKTDDERDAIRETGELLRDHVVQGVNPLVRDLDDRISHVDTFRAQLAGKERADLVWAVGRLRAGLDDVRRSRVYLRSAASSLVGLDCATTRDDAQEARDMITDDARERFAKANRRLAKLIP